MSKEAMRPDYQAGNRNAMPTVAAIVDEWRKAFPDLKVVYASENGHTLDRREPVSEDQVFTIPANYAPMREFGKKERA
jgi:hypothetical protein